MGNVQQHIGKVATIGRYEVEAVKYLGEGGSSFIFLVRSTSATYGGNMVLKRLLADSEASYKLIESEIRMHERFKHPQVVEYLASHSQRVPGRSGQREVFILMEYCPNGHLHDNMHKMGDKRFSETELLRTFRSLCVYVRPAMRLLCSMALTV
jgi:serine/threonine protein kinase